MERHPGGEDQTMELLREAGLSPCRVLDMGAGGGESVRLLASLGHDAVGIDLEPGPGVERGDMLSMRFSDGEFDAVLSQCAFFVSGDEARAFAEAARVLRPGGVLIFSDVCVDGRPAAEDLARSVGLEPIALRDERDAWRRWLAELAWRGEDLGCSDERLRGCGYMSMICRKVGERDGCV